MAPVCSRPLSRTFSVFLSFSDGSQQIWQNRTRVNYSSFENTPHSYVNHREYYCSQKLYASAVLRVFLLFGTLRIGKLDRSRTFLTAEFYQRHESVFAVTLSSREAFLSKNHRHSTSHVWKRNLFSHKSHLSVGGVKVKRTEIIRFVLYPDVFIAFRRYATPKQCSWNDLSYLSDSIS